MVAYRAGTGRRDSIASSRLDDAESVEKKQDSVETKPEPHRRRRRRGRRRPTGDYKSATGAGTKESVASAPPAPESVASAPPQATEAPKAGVATESDHGDSDVVKP